MWLGAPPRPAPQAFPQTFAARPAPDIKQKRLKANVERKKDVDAAVGKSSSLAAKALAMRCKVPLKTERDATDGAAAPDDDDLDDMPKVEDDSDSTDSDDDDNEYDKKKKRRKKGGAGGGVGVKQEPIEDEAKAGDDVGEAPGARGIVKAEGDDWEHDAGASDDEVAGEGMGDEIEMVDADAKPPPKPHGPTGGGADDDDEELDEEGAKLKRLLGREEEAEMAAELGGISDDADDAPVPVSFPCQLREVKGLKVDDDRARGASQRVLGLGARHDPARGGHAASFRLGDPETAADGRFGDAAVGIDDFVDHHEITGDEMLAESAGEADEHDRAFWFAVLVHPATNTFPSRATDMDSIGGDTSRHEDLPLEGERGQERRSGGPTVWRRHDAEANRPNGVSSEFSRTRRTGARPRAAWTGQARRTPRSSRTRS